MRNGNPRPLGVVVFIWLCLTRLLEYWNIGKKRKAFEKAFQYSIIPFIQCLSLVGALWAHIKATFFEG
jgi:hypothetical protein